MKTLQQYIEETHITTIDLLKMDIEGMEFEVLNSRDDKSCNKIQTMIIEIHLLNENMQHQFENIRIRLKML
jgi:FkbM family methyltransferase